MVNELIDRYVAGEFQGEERKRIEEYFIKSSARGEKVQFAHALSTHKARANAKHLQRRSLTRYLAVAAGVAVVVALGYGILRPYLAGRDLKRGVTALQAAYLEVRPLEVRITGFPYAPRLDQRGGLSRVDSKQLDLAARLLLSESTDNPSANSHFAAGQYYLATRQLQPAVAELNQALKLDPNNANVHSDLGAALLEEGKTLLPDAVSGQGVRDFAESLTHLNRALELNSNQLAALFNRALLHEYLGLSLQAQEDWKLYLQLDSSSKWSDEARRNLQRLEQKSKTSAANGETIRAEFVRNYAGGNNDQCWKLISDHHNRAGNILMEGLLDLYLSDSSNAENKSEANQTLSLFRFGSELIKQKSGDLYFEKIGSIYQSSQVAVRKTLIQARDLVKQGHNGWGKVNVEDSLKLFSKAKELFDSAGDVPESMTMDYWIAFCQYRLHKNDSALSTLEPLIKFTQSSNLRFLLARSLYLLASVQFNLNQHSNAVDNARRSLAVCEETNDTVGMINALSSLIEYFRYLGNYELSLGYIQRAIPITTSIAMDPIQGARHFGFEAMAFAAAGQLTAAHEFQREAVRLAVSSGNASVISYNYAFLGMISGRMGNLTDASNEAELAYETARNHGTDAADRELMAYAMLQRGNIQRAQRNFDDAVTSYNNSISTYEAIDHPTNLYQAYKGRFLCFVAQNKVEAAKGELAKTLKLAEAYRDKILEETLRDSYFNAEQSLYDVAIDFTQSQLNDTEKSFEISELSRARSLLDLVHSDSEVLSKNGEPEVIAKRVWNSFSAAEIRSELPEQSQIVQYAVLKDKLLIWVVDKNRITVTSTAVSEQSISDAVVTFLRLASTPTDSNGSALLDRARQLYQILISPVEGLLDSRKQICVVPDKVLNHLPFSALVSPASGEYLLKSFYFTMAPSSTIFILYSQIAREKGTGKEESLLSVGNPAVDHQRYPTYQDLPDAEEEAKEVATYYKSSSSLTGPAAQVSVVKRAMLDADVVHLALHSDLNKQFPLRSKLLFSKDRKSETTDPINDGALNAWEIYRLKLPRTKLVVLSACETGAEQYFGGEGMISIARPFIAARVPLVVASLWSVDSRATKELMVNFQRLRKLDRLSTVEALHQAQLKMLTSTDESYRRPYYWAPFVVMGGYAEF